MMAILARNTAQHRDAISSSRLKPDPKPGGSWALTVSGVAVDLVKPTPEMIVWSDVAWHLAKVERFAGAVPERSYSVAQHCVVGADYLAARTGAEAALAFLLHDAHEYILGDDTTPKLRALIDLANDEFPNRAGYPAGEIVRAAFKTIKFNFDAAIYRAAGMKWPLSEDLRVAVKQVDASLLVTERARLLPQNRYAWGAQIENTAPLPIRKGFEPLSRADAELLWLDRLQRYAPHLKGIRHGR